MGNEAEITAAKDPEEIPMNAATLGRSILMSPFRRSRSNRAWAAVVLAAAAMLALGGWVAYRGLADPWPARAVLRGPDNTWPLGFSPDGRTFLTSSPEGITPWDVATGREGGMPRKLGSPGIATLGAFSPDGGTLAVAVVVGRSPAAIELIDVASGRNLATVSTNYPTIYHLGFDADGRGLRAIMGGGAGALEVVTWDAATGRPTSTRPIAFPVGKKFVVASPDGRSLAYCPPRGSVVELWDLDGDRSLGALSHPTSTRLVSWGGLGFSADGRTLAVGHEDGRVELWDVRTRRLLRTIPAHSDGYAASMIRFSPDGRTLVSGGRHRRGGSALVQIRREFFGSMTGPDRGPRDELVVMDVATGRRLARAVSAIHPFFTPDGRTVATCEGDLGVKLRDVPASR